MPNNFLTNYFGFNKQQRRGLFVLLSISFLLLLLRLSYPHVISPKAISIQNLPLLEKQLDSGSTANYDQWRNKETSLKSSVLFAFDPNTVSFDELVKLGFSEKTAGNLLKYRHKGFVFKQKQDLKKVYGLSDPLYERLEPYISFPPQHQKPEQQVPKANEKTPALSPIEQVHPIELNSADSSALIAVKGIGATYAKRILKYRSMLGGYLHIEQLKEVYGFNEELYAQVKTNFTVNQGLISKIRINTDDFKVINKHPYISYELCKTIFDWRGKTNITAFNLKDIIKDETLYQKLLPYLSF